MPQNENITFRPASRADLPALVALYRELESDVSNVTLGRAGQIFDRIEEYPNYSIYLALDGADVIGTFALLIMDAIGERCQPVGVVEDVVVARLARGKGIGKSMMVLAMEKCAAAGCYKMMLSSNIRRTGAHRFYESLGFEQHGISFVVPVESDE